MGENFSSMTWARERVEGTLVSTMLEGVGGAAFGFIF